MAICWAFSARIIATTQRAYLLRWQAWNWGTVAR
jgi:hypothetical protein